MGFDGFGCWIWVGLAKFGQVWGEVTKFCWAGDRVWFGMVWYGMVWYGLIWFGMIWYGLVWFGSDDQYIAWMMTGMDDWQGWLGWHG